MSIKDHLPPQNATTPVQGQIPRELKAEVLAAKGKLTWSELMTACFKQYLAETQKEPVPAGSQNESA